MAVAEVVKGTSAGEGHVSLSQEDMFSDANAEARGKIFIILPRGWWSTLLWLLGCCVPLKI